MGLSLGSWEEAEGQPLEHNCQGGTLKSPSPTECHLTAYITYCSFSPLAVTQRNVTARDFLLRKMCGFPIWLKGTIHPKMNRYLLTPMVQQKNSVVAFS